MVKHTLLSLTYSGTCRWFWRAGGSHLSVMQQIYFSFNLTGYFRMEKTLKKPFICFSRTSMVLWLLRSLSALPLGPVRPGHIGCEVPAPGDAFGHSFIINPIKLHLGHFRIWLEKIIKQVVPFLFQPQEVWPSRNLALGFYNNSYLAKDLEVHCS